MNISDRRTRLDYVLKVGNVARLGNGQHRCCRCRNRVVRATVRSTQRTVARIGRYVHCGMRRAHRVTDDDNQQERRAKNPVHQKHRLPSGRAHLSAKLPLSRYPPRLESFSSYCSALCRGVGNPVRIAPPGPRNGASGSCGSRGRVHESSRNANA